MVGGMVPPFVTGTSEGGRDIGDIPPQKGILATQPHFWGQHLSELQYVSSLIMYITGGPVRLRLEFTPESTGELV